MVGEVTLSATRSMNVMQPCPPTHTRAKISARRCYQLSGRTAPTPFPGRYNGGKPPYDAYDGNSYF
jgi:hypothetical protein